MADQAKIGDFQAQWRIQELTPFAPWAFPGMRITEARIQQGIPAIGTAGTRILSPRIGHVATRICTRQRVSFRADYLSVPGFAVDASRNSTVLRMPRIDLQSGLAFSGLCGETATAR